MNDKHLSLGFEKTLCMLAMLCLFVSCAGTPRRLSERMNRGNKQEYLVGAYYFAGWWRELPNKYHIGGEDWRKDYPERLPLLGEYNEQETMDREIDAAASHGVDFFQILWYYQGADEPRNPRLNRGVEQFIASSKNGSMKFTIEYVNHPPFQIENEEEWKAACEEWCRIMAHPRYLRIDGRPVFKIHGLHHFLNENGKDMARVSSRIGLLREVAKNNGIANPLISSGVMVGGIPSLEVLEPYDFLTTYMDMPRIEKREELYPYSMLTQWAERGWKEYAESCSKPYVPYLSAGWDPRPWRDPRPSYNLPSREEWGYALQRLKMSLDARSNLGIPLENGGRAKMLLIYAWNEFGEGGIVAPTQGDGTMKLECIREVFGD